MPRACDREPGLSTRSRTPRRRNSPSSAVANSLAGEPADGIGPVTSGLRVVVVELGELLFELTDALLLLLVAVELIQEGGVVVRRDRRRRVPPRGREPLAAEQEPQHGADDGKHDDHDD